MDRWLGEVACETQTLFKAGRLWASGNEKCKPNLLCRANVPPLIPGLASSHMSCFPGPLAIIKCKITFNTPFLESFRGSRRKKRPGRTHHFNTEAFWKERETFSLSLVQIKGLRKYVLMEVNCSQWETCDLQSGKVLQEESRASPLYSWDVCREATQHLRGAFFCLYCKWPRSG